MHASLVSALVVAVLAGFSVPAFAANVEISRRVSPTAIHNGDVVEAGYALSVNGAHPQERVLLQDAWFVIRGRCSNGSSRDTLMIALSPGPAGGWVLRADSHASLPTGDATSAKTFEGSTVAHVCGGGGAILDPAGGGTLSANLRASARNTIQIKMHYRDLAGAARRAGICASASRLNAVQACGTSWTIAPDCIPAPLEPAFTIEKEQELAGEPAFTKRPLTGSLGQAVLYRILVKNTGPLPLELSNFSDTGCTGLAGGPATSTLAPGSVTSWTCEHVLTRVGVWANEASVEGDRHTKKSNTVIATVPPKPAFTIEKLQEMAGAGTGFTTEALQGAVGETVDYEIVVTNTGDVPLHLLEFTDAKCTGLAGGPGSQELGPDQVATYTCSHQLTETGSYTNTASVVGAPPTEEGFPVTHTSNTVVVSAEQPEFTIEKEQKLAGSPSFTRSRLSAKVGETVDYEVTVRNVSNLPVKLGRFADANCQNIAGGRTGGVLKAGEAVAYTCERKLTEGGEYVNGATVEGNGKAKASNLVTVWVEEPEFKIEKEQRIAGEAAFTKNALSAKVGGTVDYAVAVRNLGNVPLKLEHFSDPNCEGIAGGPGGKELLPAESTIFTCEHVLSATGEYANEASVEGSSGTGTRTSNRVVVNVSAEQGKVVVKAVCTISESAFKLSGVSGEKRSPFTVRFSALGVKEITFYLGKRKLKTLKASQARKGVFTIKIDPRKLSYGPHVVSVKTVMTDAACSPIARAAVFVHPRPAFIKPSFTG